MWGFVPLLLEKPNCQIREPTIYLGVPTLNKMIAKPTPYGVLYCIVCLMTAPIMVQNYTYTNEMTTLNISVKSLEQPTP